MNPTGPHPVGVADMAATCVAPGVDRLAARLFYPCVRSWTLPCSWISHFNYARGYVGYLYKYVKQRSIKTELTKAALISAAWALGSSRVLPVYYNAQLASPASSPPLLPIVVFSHGLAGTRNTYSSICIELASQGYLVMAIEHSDGSASAARLPRMAATAPTTSATAAAAASAAGSNNSNPPHASAYSGAHGSGSSGSNGKSSSPSGGGSDWMFYGGLGDSAEQLRKTSHRVAEAEAALRLLDWINQGQLAHPHGCIRELPAAVAASMAGRLDLSRVAVAGHSYGGATAAAAAAQSGGFRAAVCLDPWWDCFAPQWPVVAGWRSPQRPPLLVVGSEDWNTPNAQGKLKCGGENQERVLAAAAAAAPPAGPAPATSLHGNRDRDYGGHNDSASGNDGGSMGNNSGSNLCDGGGGGSGGGEGAVGGGGGGGAVFVVPRGSTHGNFDDVMLLFGKTLSLMLRLFNIRSSLEPRMAHRINIWCITHFLETHMPPASSASASSPSPTAAASTSHPGNNKASGTAAAAAAAAANATAPTAGNTAAGKAAHVEYEQSCINNAGAGDCDCDEPAQRLRGSTTTAAAATTIASSAATATAAAAAAGAAACPIAPAGAGSAAAGAAGGQRQQQQQVYRLVRGADLAAYREALGQWATVLRVVPAAGVGVGEQEE